MSAMKVLVTGAGGFIGRHVVENLLARGHRVLACETPEKAVHPGAERVDIPIFSGDNDIYDQLGSPDAVIHLAWRDGFIHNSSAHMCDLSAHIVFMNHMIDAGLPILSTMGSMHEIGYWEGMVTNDSPCNPLTQYGIAKNALRQSLLLYINGKSTSLRWLRAYYIYGDNAHGSSIFSKIYAAAHAGQKDFPFNSGRNQYDFIGIDQIAHQIVSATIQNEYDGIINVCSGHPVSLAEKVEGFITENHLDIRLKYGAFQDRPYDSPAIWGDDRIIQSILEKE